MGKQPEEWQTAYLKIKFGSLTAMIPVCGSKINPHCVTCVPTTAMDRHYQKLPVLSVSMSPFSFSLRKLKTILTFRKASKGFLEECLFFAAILDKILQVNRKLEGKLSLE